MSKLILFSLLWWLVGNPFLALLIIIVIIYALDRKFVGIFPSLTRPWKRRRNESKLRQQITLNASDVSARFDLARSLLERKKHAEAIGLLQDIRSSYEQSADYWCAVGTAELMEGDKEQGEAHLLQALDINPRVQYGEPYLRLAAAFKDTDHNKALAYLEQFQSIQSSSSEGYYLSGMLYRSLGMKSAAAEAFTQALAVYRSLPKYRRRSERKWALRSWYRKLTG
ncbi:tetratricopeptide repeat protein [Paenibacillus medicaginis]|uniref:Tetratricopeptide repeat protein n=1 Tax=Paenibacillus medicaginis TaxID=1470560 RepID=A0ABV5BWX5_9BACL